MVVCAATLLGPRADAACHAFSVSALPSTVSEGSTVTVTVSRDGDVADSSVHVSTVDQTARAPGDYEALDQEVEFTSGTSQEYEIDIENDPTTEGEETFLVRLSDPSGCAPNSNYQLGPAARVTIRASDPTPPPTEPPPTPPPAVTTAPPSSPTPTPTPTPAPTETPAPTPTPSPTGFTLAEDDDLTGGEFPALAVAGLVIGILATGAGAWLLWQRRRLA